MIFECVFLTDDKLKNKTGRFDVSDFKILDDDFDYGKIFFTIDGEEYDNSLSSFTKNLDERDIFKLVLNAYLRSSSDFKFIEGWDIFENVKKWRCTENGIVITLPSYECDELILYDLILYTPDNMFYRIDDNYLLLDEEGNIKTNIESFWFDGLIDSLVDIRLGKEKLLYKSSDFEQFEEAEYEDLIQEIIQERGRE